MTSALFEKVLIANRGEIALRIARAAAELGMKSSAIYTNEDSRSLHIRRTDEAHHLPKQGVAGYLDIEGIIEIARRTGCDAIHPGYGFLSENADFARACAAAGITFVGPSPEVLAVLGDKGAARALADKAKVAIARGTSGGVALDEIEQFMRDLGGDGGIILKAVSGGGGRGMRVVRSIDELPAAYERAASEASSAFGNAALYAEELIVPARHVEVQVLGDRTGAVVHAFDRECSIQRRYQKLIEIAPVVGLSEPLRQRIFDSAVTLAATVKAHTLCTFEFLTEASGGEGARFVFMEANPRLQVEHTVTEEVLGLDLVHVQFRLAAGATLDELKLRQEEIGRPRGVAVQLRVNMERIGRDGSATPTGGVLRRFEPASGAGIRVETAGYLGYQTTTAFDSLLAKLIAHAPSGSLADAAVRAFRASCEFNIDGVETNLALLQSLLQREEFQRGQFDTQFFEANVAELIECASEHAKLHAAPASATIDRPTARATLGPAGEPVTSVMTGTVVAMLVRVGDEVTASTPVAVIEAMKMEHEIIAGVTGIVRSIAIDTGRSVDLGDVIIHVEPRTAATEVADAGPAEHDPTAIRPDLAKVLARYSALLDAARPEAVARRRKTGQRTVRENIDDLCDPDSFIEYGGLAVAAQRDRYSFQELVKVSPADGLVAGLGTVNAGVFGAEAARCAVIAYDYTVFAGTQGFRGLKKTDRLLELITKWRIPLVSFAEGGGGRAGETDFMGIYGMDIPTYRSFAALSGLVPLACIVSGRCFAGNAVLAACSDVVIATKNANIGLAGPALIEGGGLGKFRPEEIGPVHDLAPAGSVDIVVADEAEAVALAKQYLSYFQGSSTDWACADQHHLRLAIPDNRKRAYDVRKLIDLLADTGSVLELRTQHGVGMITSLVRVEGRSFGLIANNPFHLGGAIDGEAAGKAGRFLELCNRFSLPVVSLMDTPGFMVGPVEEQKGMLRKAGGFLIALAGLSTPYFSVCTRKGYGLGAQAMAAGNFLATTFTVAWPTGEFGGMGIEGEIRLGFRKQLEAIEDPNERKAEFDRLVAEHYALGEAPSMASYVEIDAVIDPADTRRWIIKGLNSTGFRGRRIPHNLANEF